MASRRPSELKYDRTDTHLSGLSEAISYTNRHKRSSEVILSSSKGSRDYEDSQRSELENKDDSHRLIDELINKCNDLMMQPKTKLLINGSNPSPTTWYFMLVHFATITLHSNTTTLESVCLYLHS